MNEQLQVVLRGLGLCAAMAQPARCRRAAVGVGNPKRHDDGEGGSRRID